MKKILLLALLTPAISVAQKLEFGINGGMTAHTAPSHSYGKVHNDIGYYAGARAAFSFLGFQAGIGVDAIKMTGTREQILGPTMELNIADPAITPHLFINKKISLPKSYLYFGLSAGYTFVNYKSNKAFLDTRGHIADIDSKGSGFMGGLQLGYVFLLTSHLGINAEAAARYYNYSPHDPATSTYNKYRLFAFPVSVGVRYRL